ncbi:MAG: hypothetical protein EBY39_12485, partial [Flavobacteriia bacterium]|nr:hypothetical protein [Flavobacteriia bacterium]
MSLNPTGSLNFSWAKPSIPFEDLHVYTYKNDIFLNSRTQTSNSLSVGGLIEGDSVFLKIIPQSGGALFTNDAIETARQAIPVTNFHPNTLDINKIFFNGLNLSKSRDAHGVYKATGKYNTIDFNIDLEIINPRDSGIISYVGEEPFFSGVRFYENLSGINYTTGFSENFRFSSQNSIGQRSLNFNFIAEDIYGSGVSGSLELINDPPEILSKSSTFDTAEDGGFVGFSIFPETSVDTNRIDYKIYSDQTYTSHFISGTTSEPSIITGLFPVGQTGYIEMVPFDFLGSGVTYRDPNPFVPNLSSFVPTNSIASHFAFGNEMTSPVAIEMTVTEEHDSGYYTKLSIDSSSSGSFNVSSYFTGLFEDIYSGYHFDVFNNRTGSHEKFYYNLEIYKSGTNSLEDAAQGSFFMPNPHFAENSVDFDYRNGSTKLGFDSVPHYSYTGVNILLSGEHDSHFSIYSGNSLYSGDINVKARARLVRSFDNQIFDEITISGSGVLPSVSLKDIPYPYLDGTVNQVLGNPNASVYIDSVSVFRKPTFSVIDGIVPANFSGILDFNDYANYF